MLSQGFFDTGGPDIDMNIVRSIQKRLAVVVNVTNLPSVTRGELRKALEALKQQGACNTVVDEVRGQKGQFFSCSF